jgi:2-dehydro-3-deoxyphosphogluconate aldolase/(4S)-4-hydroxy-2-oxoglutarate aldolase
MKASFCWERFEALPIVGILRGFPMRLLPGLLAAVRRGGLRTVEITMNTPGAAEQIQEAVQLAGEELTIGAGTVQDLAGLDAALTAGATFIVTPVVNEPVIRRCVERRVPVFPGAFTPTEIQRAWDLGASLVKVFPADVGGPAFIKALKAPLPHVKLLPTGGVDLASLPEYVRAGADAIGIGGPLFDRERIVAEDWPWLEQRCQAFAEAWRTAASSRVS